MSNRQRLRKLLKDERPLVMPDAHDGLSARLIQTAGFKAVQCSGFSTRDKPEGILYSGGIGSSP